MTWKTSINEMSDKRWTDGLGDYLVNEDGSMDRIVPVPEAIRIEAQRRGIKLKPDHIPADEVERWKQEDRLTYKPGDLELVNIGNGPLMSKVEEERRRLRLPKSGYSGEAGIEGKPNSGA